MPDIARFTSPPRAGRMLFLTAGWGACFVAIRYGLADAPPLWFAALRALVAGGALLAVAAMTRRPAPPRSAWPGIVALAAVNVAVAFGAMFLAASGVASGVAAVLANAQPLLIVLPAWLLYQERPSPRVLVALLIGLAGLGITAAPGGLGGGAALSLGAAAAITVGTLLARRLSGVDVVTLSGWQFVIGGVMLAGWAAASGETPDIHWRPQFVAALAFLALIGTAATYLIWFSELQRAPLVSLTAWTLLTPVFGIAFGWLLLGDRLTAQQAVGVALVLAALPLAVLPGIGRRDVRHDRTPPQPGSDPDRHLAAVVPKTPRTRFEQVRSLAAGWPR